MPAWSRLLAFALALTLRAETPVQIFAQVGHNSLIRTAAVSPDGRFALSGSDDQTLKLWDLASGREIRTFLGHSGTVDALAFSPDGRFALSGGSEGSLRLWHVDTGTPAYVPMHMKTGITAVAFSPDGRQALSGDDIGDLALWDAVLGIEVRPLRGHGFRGITTVVFTRDGKGALSGSRDGVLKLWDLASGQERWSVKVLDGEVRAVALSPEGRTALVGCSDGQVRLWDVAAGKEAKRFPGELSALSGVAFSPDGSLAGASGGHHVELWDVATGLERKKLEHWPDLFDTVAFTPDGKALLCAQGNVLDLWDWAAGRKLRVFEGHSEAEAALACSPDGRLALTAGGEKSIQAWDLQDGRRVGLFEGNTKGVRAVAFSPDGRFALSGGWDTSVRLFSIPGGQARGIFLGHPSPVLGVAFSPDGKTALSVSGEAMKLWDLATGKELRTFPGCPHGLNAVVFGPDGRTALAGCGFDVALWDLPTATLIRTFKGHTSNVRTVAFSPDGTLALSGGDDHTLKLWNVATGSELRTFGGDPGRVESAVFAPDGTTALSGGSDGTITLWNVADGKELRILHAGAGAVTSVGFTPDGARALGTTDGGVTVVCEVATGRELAQMISFTDGEWVVVTPEGYFNASAGGARNLNARMGNTVVGVDQFYAKFYRPERVRMALAGQALPAGESLGDILATRKAPTVTILSPAPGTQAQGAVTLVLKLADNGGGIGDVRVYLNGSQVANDTRGLAVRRDEGAGYLTLSFPLSLADGANELKAIALNRDGSMESSPATVTVSGRPPQAAPNLHALVVGINDYRNRDIALVNAVADAKGFAQALGSTAAPLFGTMDIRLLTTPEETSRAAISQAFDDLRAKVGPGDLFVFFDASHGTVDVVDGEEQYFLLTSNVLQLSSRRLGADAISQKELARLIGSIPAQKKVVFLDTCNAGKGGKEIQAALLRQTRGLNDATAIKVLQRAIGSSVFASSSDAQQALEGYHGHGLFTYVLMEGLAGKADIKKDGFITILGLADYVEENVPAISESAFKRQQTPIVQTGANFPIGKVR